MARHERIKRERLEDREADSHHKKKKQQQEYDQLKTSDEGVTDSLGKASLEWHAALLADTRSDEQMVRLVTHLQQSYGNAYVQRLLSSRIVQAKLTVNPPDDVYEREADRVAETIQRQIEPEEEELQMKASSQIQRQAEEEEEIQAKASQIQRQAEEEEEEEEPIQTRTVGSQPSVTSDDLEGQINAARGSGQPLPDSVLASLEPHLGHDFSEVQIHTDAKADSLSQKLNAEAFTTGRDIFFREGAYQPDSASGKGLIAHELTHVVQQEAPVVQRNALEPTTTTEAEAPAAGLDETRMTALRALWEATVVGPIREAYEALAGDTPDAERAITSLASTNAPLSAMRGAYTGVEPASSVLSGFYQYIARKVEELRPHVGQPRPLEQIRESINPNGETMPVWFNRVTQAI